MYLLTNKQNPQSSTNLKDLIDKYILRPSGAWHFYSELSQTSSLVTLLCTN